MKEGMHPSGGGGLIVSKANNLRWPVCSRPSLYHLRAPRYVVLIPVVTFVRKGSGFVARDRLVYHDFPLCWTQARDS
jgi:hypothetical protein